MECFVEVGNWSIIEAPFTLFDEQMKVLFMDTVIGSQVTFSLVPKALDTIDVIGLLGKEF